MKKMKKLLYLFLAVSFIFTACKKEEGCMDTIATNYNPDAEVDNGSCTYSVIGVWTPTSVEKDSSLTTTINGEIIYDLNGQVMTYSGSETMTPEEADFDGELEFTSDGKMLVDGDVEMDYYTYSNSVLTVTDDDTTMEWACSVTSTNLSITIEESMDTSWFEPGMGDITISAYAGQTIHWSRNTSGAINTNISQRVGNTDYSWFVKPKLNNIIKSIKK